MANPKRIKISVIGGGVAGYSAAIALARSHIEVNLFTGFSPGGQIVLAPQLKNYPGIEVTGTELISNMYHQTIPWNVKVWENIAIEKFCFDNNLTLVDSNGKEFFNDAVIVATGKRFNKLNLAEEEKFFGRGLSYCVLCDGPLFKNEIVGVVGGGDSAAQGALYLSDFVKKIHIFVRANKMRAGEDYQKLLRKNKKIEVHYNVAVGKLLGEKMLSEVVLNNGEVVAMTGIFIAIGSDPQTELVKDFIKLDSKGFIITDNFGRTNLEYVYAAGDVVAGKYKQAVIAAGDGYAAALTALQDLKKKIN
ncbi:MAG: FAD-dependent oxidoreductase [Cytophagales bacterium]|jgi:thioredoxin reductase (NADPH)|nr:FAD-dependent oxidoreductase [Cytophagales bacterium]